LKKPSLAAATVGLFSYSQSFAGSSSSSSPKHNFWTPRGLLPFCRYIYGPANLYYICTALYKSLYKR
jgi:hypothetical protein